MDPICHTLVGGALAETGLKRWSAGATATCLIGANLPDVDVAALFWSAETGLWFRRGVTHGVLGLLILPLLLAGAMALWYRWRTVSRGSGSGFDARRTLALAYLAAVTHPLLDFLNVYGMRWLYPFSETWTYGDTLFIVDPWAWAILGAGILLARRGAPGSRGAGDTVEASAGGATAGRSRPWAFWALGALVAYVAVMAASNLAGRQLVRQEMSARGHPPDRLMVAPVPVNPFKRWVVVESDDTYHFGELNWLGTPRFQPFDITYPRYPSGGLPAAAGRGPKPRKFLSWARFPYDRVEDAGDHYIVYIADARYTLDPEGGWATTRVRFEK